MNQEFITDKLKEWVIVLVINVIVAVIIYFSTKSWVTTIITALATLAFLLILFYSTLLLHAVKESGIRRVRKDSPDPTPMLQIYFRNSRRIRFLAIRGARMMGTDRSVISYIIEELPRNWDGKIEILLLHPESHHLKERALELDRDPDKFAKDCLGSIQNIVDLKQKYGIHIEPRVYDRKPIIRAVIFDDRALLSYYIGKDAHIPIQYEIKGGSNSLFRMINLLYDDLWNDSKPAEDVLRVRK